MKKFLIACLCILIIVFIMDYAYYNLGGFILFENSKEIKVQSKNEGKEMYVQTKDGMQPYEIQGVNMGVGIPGHFATEFAVKKSDYLRWFKQIQDMGANTIRVYTILSDVFYEAIYEYNTDNENPLYFIHGLWVNDYVQNSRLDAYAPEFIDQFIKDGKTLIDIIHGKKKMYMGAKEGSGFYKRDVSQWFIGYILGVEWEDVTVAFTNEMRADKNEYHGTYMYTSPEATPFEALLTQVGDKLIEYETKRYSQQRLVAFSNWPTTDPFDYPTNIRSHFRKIVNVDVEHIKLTDKFKAGTFASYHIYPYYPDYLAYYGDINDHVDKDGDINTYYAYLKKVNEHHTIPVVISEFGVPTSRGMAQRDTYTNRNQGYMSEKEQGNAIIECYEDIKDAGCSGAVIFTWQDEWFKRTWNTMHSSDLLKTAYWSDYQTNEQYFGLLSFDPGKEKSICYVDGNVLEWKDEDIVSKNDDMTLSVKYDEKFIYMMVHKPSLTEDTKLYIPVDITPKSGSFAVENYGISMDRKADFVIAIDGKNNSRMVTHERYDVLKAMYSHEVFLTDAYENPPEINSPLFNPIHLVLQTANNLMAGEDDVRTNFSSESYETGLMTYGNANPESPDFNSLADFCYGGEYLEIKLPWQLFNFSNPSEGIVHDDYYIHYGVMYINIKEMYFGIGDEENKETPINLLPVKLKYWRNQPTYHERLKLSYYEIQAFWNEEKIE